MTSIRVSHAAPHLWQRSDNGMPPEEAGYLPLLTGPVRGLRNMVSVFNLNV